MEYDVAQSGHPAQLNQAWVDGILQPTPSHNDYLMAVPMNEYSVKTQAHFMAGASAVPEPSSFLVVLGALLLLRRFRLNPRPSDTK